MRHGWQHPAASVRPLRTLRCTAPLSVNVWRCLERLPRPVVRREGSWHARRTSSASPEPNPRVVNAGLRCAAPVCAALCAARCVPARPALDPCTIAQGRCMLSRYDSGVVPPTGGDHLSALRQTRPPSWHLCAPDFWIKPGLENRLGGRWDPIPDESLCRVYAPDNAPAAPRDDARPLLSAGSAPTPGATALAASTQRIPNRSAGHGQ